MVPRGNRWRYSRTHVKPPKGTRIPLVSRDSRVIIDVRAIFQNVLGELEMASGKMPPQKKETPSERFEKVAKKALERDRRARERREAKDRAATPTTTQ